MTTVTAHSSKLPTAVEEIAAHWRQARAFYPVYAAIYREHRLGPLCADLESPIDRNDAAAIGRIWKWFADADTKVEAWQLRQLCLTSHLGNEQNLRILAAHFLRRDDRAAHRDKIDFLLVQYFTQCAPLAVHEREDFDLEIVAEVLEPVIGEAVPHEPRCARPLHDELEKIRNCHSLGELLAAGVLERGREVKESAGEMFFGTAALLAFTRFNFLVRRAFFRLMQADLAAVRALLRELEARGVSAVDCTTAGLDAAESLAGLRRFCNNWKVLFRAPYACGRPLLALVNIREAAERALEQAKAAPPPDPEAVLEAAPEAAVQEEVVLPELEEQEAVNEPVAEPAAKAEVAPPIAAEEELQAPPAEPLAEPPAPEEISSIAPGPPEAPAAVALPAIEQCLEEIAPQLLQGKHSVTVTRINCGGSKLLISSWEAAAFIRGGDETSDALQRAVAARSILVQAMERHKAGETSWLQPALRVARDEMAQIQNQIARAKEARDIDAAVNLAATATRLSSLVQEVTKLGD
jgi:hypothetical protein